MTTEEIVDERCGLHSCTDQLQFFTPREIKLIVVACTHARISYNRTNPQMAIFLLWLALMHGSVTIGLLAKHYERGLWLALMHGSVTICMDAAAAADLLWLALMHGSVTIKAGADKGSAELWLALMHGSVTMMAKRKDIITWLWLALMHGSVTIGPRAYRGVL